MVPVVELPKPIIHQEGSSVSKQNKSVKSVDNKSVDNKSVDKASQSNHSKSDKNFKIDE